MMSTYGNAYGVIVVGAGHAGCEAALASARLGCKTLLLNMGLDTVAQMSCNPSIGGLAKGHLVREIDALGGEMGVNIDQTGIQYRVLNTRKGPAVRACRAQADRRLYALRMKKIVENQPFLDLKHGVVTGLIVKKNRVCGVETREGIVFLGEAVVLTTGTFMRGLIHMGMVNYPGGRAGEPASEGLSDCLRSLGLSVDRLKTGTPARLDRRSINFSILEPQYGDDPPTPFSFRTKTIDRPQVPCHITYTNERTHDLIRSGLDRSPLYGGVIEGVGPRYCPSIEDKVVRFPDKNKHQVFLEPEGLDCAEIYPSGVSTSLPPDVQLAFLRSIPGLHNVEIMRPGYAIEYDFVDPIDLYSTLETKAVEFLYHAGQINGTSGYEEAAAQGLVAGANAALKLSGKNPLIIGRDQGYIGVLIDDLVNLGAREPYRMFTSRAEYRLLLREDNADQRLLPMAFSCGLVTENRRQDFEKKMEAIEQGRQRLGSVRISGSNEQAVKQLGLEELKNGVSLIELLRRPDISVRDLLFLDEALAGFEDVVLDQLEIETKYEGYIDRQLEQVERFRKTENVVIPENFDYLKARGLSTEVREKLNKVKPRTLGQAIRIPGVTPAAISILSVFLRRG
jgi:tRNA uridine 5-carboxymethylaminomethyl modification enzyme